MSRFQDLPAYTYTFYIELGGAGISVKCPKCHGLGTVTANQDFGYFRCSSCHHQLTQELNASLYVANGFCPNCGRHIRIEVTEPKQQHVSKLNVACPHCGSHTTVPLEKKPTNIYHLRGTLGCDPLFGFELYFLTSFQGKPIWALNRAHLNYLISYLGAALRDKPPTVALKGQADALPKFMKTAKNRERILSLLQKMQQL